LIGLLRGGIGKYDKYYKFGQMKKIELQLINLYYIFDVIEIFEYNGGVQLRPCLHDLQQLDEDNEDIDIEEDNNDIRPTKRDIFSLVRLGGKDVLNPNANMRIRDLMQDLYTSLTIGERIYHVAYFG
ncbi:hypothetical protein ACJX0J_022068, partial [Zea mays]